MNDPEKAESWTRKPARLRDAEPDEQTEGALERLAVRLKRLNSQAQKLATFLSRKPEP